MISIRSQPHHHLRSSSNHFGGCLRRHGNHQSKDPDLKIISGAINLLLIQPLSFYLLCIVILSAFMLFSKVSSFQNRRIIWHFSNIWLPKKFIALRDQPCIRPDQ